MSVSATVIRARWLIPARAPAIEDGAAVCADGRIVRVGPWSKIKPHVGPGDSVEAFSDGAILPGFVNAHTHLSLSDLAGKFAPTSDFAGWIARLVAKRLVRTKSAIRRSVRKGIAEGLAAGTVAGADVTPDAAWSGEFSEPAGRWTVFGELVRFGPAGLKRLRHTVKTLEGIGAAGLRVGLAPHAPYSTGLDVYREARREADRRGWPLSTHLHETPDEIAFTESGSGSLYDLIARYGLLPRGWRPAGVRPIPMLAEAGFFSGAVLAAHANYLTDEEIRILARSGSSVAWCPRSHAFFKHADHPWRRLLAAGVNVCLGTDSLASSPSLSVLDEMRFLFGRHPDADARTLLRMGTLDGARALGLEGELGDLAQGMRADFVVVGPIAETADPLGAILSGEGNPVRTFLGGKEGKKEEETRAA